MIESNKKRVFLPETIEVTWENLKPIFEDLLKEPISSPEELENWLKKRSELEALLQEDFAWRYIHMTRYTANETYKKAFEYFTTEIEPKLAEYDNLLNKKFIGCSYKSDLKEEKYRIYIKRVEQSLLLFREENIPLFTKIQLKQQEYQSIVGGLSIEHNGEELTMQQASALLEGTDREERKKVWEKMAEKRLNHKDELDDIFDELVKLRHQVALNSGFDNFRDYMFVDLGRFDYDVRDCEYFHKAIASEAVPFVRSLAEKRKKDLGYDVLKPWDMAVDPLGRAPLKPFENGKELIDKSRTIFEKLDPFFASCLQFMQDNDLFDVESRKNKAPGGYNYPLAETGAPFIFMNSANTLQDLTTMVHEGGHAVHTFLNRDLELNAFKELPSEVAELASMSMELLSMKYWKEFFDKGEDLKRALYEQISGTADTLPWVALIDQFQHWIYTHPQHSREERKQKWVELFKEFGSRFCDWEGQEEAMEYLWHRQLHIFEVPFYYIEYAIAQLGAIAVWKNYVRQPEKALEDYKEALKLGYTKSIPKIYEKAGVPFDFKQPYVRELMAFLSEQLKSF